ncbi:hypothetical protein LINGRAHAP2_LOCUS5248 [Linum grandiflorum]
MRGKVEFWDWVDPDFLSMFDLDSYLVDFGYLQQVGTTSMEEYRLQKELSYFWCKETENIMNGLVELGTDKEVIEMALDVVKNTKFAKLLLMKIDELIEAIRTCDFSKSIPTTC